MKRIRLLLALGLIGVGTLAVSPPSASAVPYGYYPCHAKASHGGGAYACTWNTGSWIYACDTQVDGNRVRAHWITRQTTPGYFTIGPWAPSRGCHEALGGFAGTPIVKFRICIEREGCTNWRYGW